MKNIHFALALLVAGTTLLASCEKKEENKSPVAPAEQLAQTGDNNDVKAVSDQISSDATDALENFPALNGRQSDEQLTKPICGCSIDSTQLGSKQLTLNFDGTTPCLSNPRRTRQGKMILKLIQGNRFRDVGAVLQVTLIDFKVTRLSDNRYITFNGIKTIKNVRGSRNYLAILAGTDSLVYRERGYNMTAVLDGRYRHVHNLSRLTTWRYVTIQGAKQIRFRAEGDTAFGGVTNLDSWGTNRDSVVFTSALTTPVVSDTYCGLGQPNSGNLVYKAAGNTLTITLGVNNAGNLDTRDCAYGYKLAWLLAAGQSGSTVISY